MTYAGSTLSGERCVRTVRCVEPTSIWPARADPPPLGGEVHVWSARLDRPAAEMHALRAVLSPDERARASRFHRPSDRARSAACRGLLRHLLGGYLGVVPERIEFEYGPRGKPRVAASHPASRPASPEPAIPEGPSAADLHFNVAHSGGLALFAMARGAPPGVDLETIEPLDDLERLARRCFCRAELEGLLCLPEEQRTRAFYRVWTRKEAFVKSLGHGLSHPLSGFQVSTGEEDARVLAVRGSVAAARRWSLTHLVPAATAVGALALPATGRSLRRWCFTPRIVAATG